MEQGPRTIGDASSHGLHQTIGLTWLLLYTWAPPNPPSAFDLFQSLKELTKHCGYRPETVQFNYNSLSTFWYFDHLLQAVNHLRIIAWRSLVNHDVVKPRYDKLSSKSPLKAHGSGSLLAFSGLVQTPETGWPCNHGPTVSFGVPIAGSCSFFFGYAECPWPREPGVLCRAQKGSLFSADDGRSFDLGEAHVVKDGKGIHTPVFAGANSTLNRAVRWRVGRASWAGALTKEHVWALTSWHQWSV